MSQDCYSDNVKRVKNQQGTSLATRGRRYFESPFLSFMGAQSSTATDRGPQSLQQNSANRRLRQSISNGSPEVPVRRSEAAAPPVHPIAAAVVASEAVTTRRPSFRQMPAGTTMDTEMHHVQDTVVEEEEEPEEPSPQPQNDFSQAKAAAIPDHVRQALATETSSVHSESMKSTTSSVFETDNLIHRLLIEAKMDPRNPVTASVCLNENEIMSLCKQVQALFLKEQSLLELQAPVNVVGDVLGFYHELFELFARGKHPREQSYLFLGNYIGRGKRNLETILLLLLFKIRYPDTFHLLRGNFECMKGARSCGFADECKRRSGNNALRALVDVFDCMPIAAVIEKRIFCVHAGLAPEMLTLDDIKAISRPKPTPNSGLIFDLLNTEPNKSVLEVDWKYDETVEALQFGKAALEKFLKENRLDFMIRGHDSSAQGYEFMWDQKLLTVFSVPIKLNAENRYGAFVVIGEKLRCTIKVLDKARKRQKSEAPSIKSTASIS